MPRPIQPILITVLMLLSQAALGQGQEQALDVGVQLFYQGALFLMCCYNLLYFLMVRDRAYLYYSLYILAMLLVAIDGVYGFTKENPAITKTITSFSSLFVTIFYAQFIRYFLNLPQVKPRHNLYFDYWVYVRMAIAVVAMATAIYHNDPAKVMANGIVLGVFIIDIALGLWLIYISWRANYILANYIVMGYVAMTLPLSIAIMKQIVYGSADPASDGILVQAGVWVELVLFSLGLGYRSRLSEKEKLQISEENRRIVEGQKEELERMVKIRTEELNVTLQTVSKQRDNIVSSINYALRIQQAILPSEQELCERLDAFILFRPRDIVSGDFYWFANKGALNILAVADCTGHGVSGAFMTMIGSNMLNQVVHDQGIHEPSEILTCMPALLEQTLQHSEGKVKDGMDIAVVSIDLERGLLKYAGAMNPLYCVRQGELVEIKADKRPIGGRATEGFSYTQHEVEMLPGSTFYLCSDGFQDQFGGSEDRKFMVGKLKKLLAEIADKDSGAQRQLLASTFEAWKGNRSQTDDVLIVGIKF